MIFDIFYINGVFYTKLKGKPDSSSLEAYYKTLTSHNEWKNCSKVLSDETGMSYQNIKTAEMQKLAKITTNYRKEFNHALIAVFVNSDFNFGMTRMWQSYVETDWDAKVCVFKSHDEARHWLNEQ